MFLLSVDRLTFDASQVLPVDSVAPSDAICSAMASAPRVFVPSSSMCAVEIGQSGPIGRVGGAARLDHQVEVHQRQVVEFDQHHLEAVLQLEAFRLGRLERRFGAGGRRELAKRARPASRVPARPDAVAAGCRRWAAAAAGGATVLPAADAVVAGGGADAQANDSTSPRHAA